MLNELALTLPARAINQYLRLDPQTPHRLQSLLGKFIIIEVLPWQKRVYFTFHADGIEITMQSAPHEDGNENNYFMISGTLSQLSRVLSLRPQQRHQLAQYVSIKGQAELGQEVLQLFADCYIDWEERLAHIMGDVPAYYFFYAFQEGQRWITQSQQKMREDFNEYLHEETELLPAVEALQDFFSDIDVLRAAADRLAQRVTRLQSELASFSTIAESSGKCV